MDLRSLNTFIQVAELSSFTRAGAKLGYSQPTISFQIRQIEDALGVKLFDRIGHTIRLTDAGRDALAYAQRICHMADEMALGANRRSEARGVIRLAMADSLCEPLIARHFAAFRQAYPHVSLNVTMAGTAELYRLLDHNEVDMVCTLDSHIYDASYVVANEEKIGVHFICSPDNPLASRGTITVQDLAAQPFMLTEKRMSYRRLMDQRLAMDSIEIQPVLEIGSADLICSLVAEGMGLSFLPDYVTEADARSGRVVRLETEDFSVDLWRQLLYHRDKWVSLPMQAIISHLSGVTLNGAS